MSKVTDCKRSADSASRKRRQSSEQQDESASNTPRKLTKVGNARNETPSTSSLSHKNGEAEKTEEPAGKQAAEHREGDEAGDVKTGKENSSSSNGASATNSSVRQDGPEDGPDPDDGPSRVTAEKAQGPSRETVEKAQGPGRVTAEKVQGPSRVTAEKAQGPSRVAAEKAKGPSRVTAEKAQGPSRVTAEKAQGSDDAAKVDAEGEHCPSTSLDHQSDSAAIAAAEALASLTGGKGKEGEETPCSSERAGPHRPGGKVRRTGHESSKGSSKTQAAAADSSTSVHSIEREAAEDIGDGDDGDDSIPGSSSTPSSSFPSDNDDNDGSECAIVSVKMAPEIRQSVALLAQVQMRLEALDKKSARLHQRLDLKMSRQQRPHLDQRRSITQSIPGFWVTALLNHPHLSAHIDETDEDALSYMTDLEIESFKGNKVGHRIRFHFKRNPYFQNNIIMKEVHLGMGGPPVSFSNPILWHRGQNLTAHSEPRKSSRGVYQTFFSWFSDHSNPGRDDIAQILKDDLWRDPLRYYLTPLWEPRENGSGSSGTKAPDNSNRDECVVISDSDEEDQEQDEADEGHSREEEEDGEDDEEERGQDSDESPEEDEAGQIMTDASEDREDEDEEDEKDEDVYVEELDETSMDHKTRDPNDDEEDVEVDEEDDSKD